MDTFWRNRRVFLTGHTGFKGSWLSWWLVEMGAEVTGYALRPPTEPSLFALSGLERRMRSIDADVRDYPALRSAMTAAKPDVVFHMAAQALVRPSFEHPVETYAVNVMGTVHVLEAARNLGTRCAVVIVTSDKCYDNREWPWAYRENEPMGGYDPYSSSKGCAELVTSAYRRSYFGGGEPVAVASVRAGNVIGGGDWATDRLIPDCVRALSQGQPVMIRNPDSVRPWQHVLEPLSGYLTVAERLTGSPKEFAQGWNFGPSEDEAQPVRWIADFVTKAWSPDARWIRMNQASVHEAGMLKLDSALARTNLGWRPQLSLARALELTIDWYRRQSSGEDAAELTLSQIRAYMTPTGNGKGV